MGNKNKMLTINGVTGDQDYIWFTTKEYPALFELNKRTRRTRVIRLLDENHPDAESLYGVLKKYEDKIYIAPMCGNAIFIYDIKADNLSVHKLFDDDCNRKFKFRSVLCRDGHIYFIGCTLAAIVEIDSKTGSLHCIPFFEGNLVYCNENNVIATTNDNVLYWAGTTSGRMVKFNFDTKLIEILNVPEKMSCIGVCKVNSRLLFLSNDRGKILERNMVDGQMRDLVLPNGFISKYRNYCTVLAVGDDVWFVPFKSNMLMRYEVNSAKIKCVREFRNEGEIIYIYGGEYGEGFIWGFDNRSETLDIINTSTEAMEQYKIGRIDGIEILDNWYIKNAKTLCESSTSGVNLRNFINNLLSDM